MLKIMRVCESVGENRSGDAATESPQLNGSKESLLQMINAMETIIKSTSAFSYIRGHDPRDYFFLSRDFRYQFSSHGEMNKNWKKDENLRRIIVLL